MESSPARREGGPEVLPEGRELGYALWMLTALILPLRSCSSS
jgi:hypothetical protein